MIAAQPTDNARATPGRLVVMSDGATTDGRSNESAAAAAADARVPVDTIAFGTPSGQITVDGETTDVPVEPEPLQAIASTTDGRFYEADSLDALSSAYHDIGDVVGHRHQKRPIDGWFIGSGLALLTVAGLLSLLWAQRLP
jgi:Ca-activated chloride channel family protein